MNENLPEILFFFFVGEVEDELLHTYTRVYTFDTLLLMVRLAVLVAVTLTVPIVLFPVSIQKRLSILLEQTIPENPFYALLFTCLVYVHPGRSPNQFKHAHLTCLSIPVAACLCTVLTPPSPRSHQENKFQALRH